MHTPIVEKLKKIMMIWWLVIFGISSRLSAELITHLDGNKEQLYITVKEFRDFSKPDFKNELDRALIITLENRRNRQTKEIVWRGPLRKINKLEFCPSSKILLMGEIPFSGSSSGGNYIIVLDSELCAIQDTIRCYDYSLSPSRRFLVYKTWYPRMVLPEFRKSIILIYDLEKPQAANRYPLITKYSYRNAGFPIFPEANAYFIAFDPNSLDSASNLKPYDVNLDDHYYLTSPFLWSDNSKELVFFAYNRNEQTNYLVRIDLNDGMDKVTIFRKPVNMADLIKWDVISDVTAKELTEKPYTLAVKSLQWSDKNKIVVEPYHQYWLDKELEMLLP